MNTRVLKLAKMSENQNLSTIRVEGRKLLNQRQEVVKKQDNLKLAAEQLLNVYREVSNIEVEVDSISLKEKYKWANRALNLKLLSDEKANSLNSEINTLEKAITINKIEKLNSKNKLIEQEIKIKLNNQIEIAKKTNIEIEDLIEVKLYV